MPTRIEELKKKKAAQCVKCWSGCDKTGNVLMVV